MREKKKRATALRVILYLLQGSFLDADSRKECLRRAKENCFLLYEMGLFPIMTGMLTAELEEAGKKGAGEEGERGHMGENWEMRLILSALYLMTETMRR